MQAKIQEHIKSALEEKGRMGNTDPSKMVFVYLGLAATVALAQIAKSVSDIQIQLKKQIEEQAAISSRIEEMTKEM